MTLSICFYVVLPNLVLYLLLWVTRKTGDQRRKLFGVVVITTIFLYLSVMWARSMIAGNGGIVIYGTALIAGYIGILIGTVIRNRTLRMEKYKKQVSRGTFGGRGEP